MSVEFDGKLLDLAQNVAVEDGKIHRRIDKLSDDLSAEISARMEIDDRLSVALSHYTDYYKHYELTSIDTAPQMPMKAKEFAVNRLINYDLPNAFIVDGNHDKLVGYVENYDVATGACRFTAYSDANYHIDTGTSVTYLPYTLILGYGPYDFGEGQNQKTCANGIHKLVYGKSEDFESNRFDIRLIQPNIRNVYYDGVVIGHIYNAPPDSAISSGVLQFDPEYLITDHYLSVFADSREIQFSVNTSPVTAYDNGNSKLWIQPEAGRFYFETKISTWYMMRVFTDDPGSELNARIYRDYYEKPDGESVSAFAVSMYPVHETLRVQRDYFLSRDGGFETVLNEYPEDSSFDLLKYDDENKVLSYTREKKLYSCPVVLEDNGHTITFGLSSTIFNKLPSETDEAKISFNELTALPGVQEAIIPLIRNREYVLTRSGDVLSCDIIDALGIGRIRTVINGDGSVDIDLSAANGSRAVFNDPDDYVEFGTVIKYHDQTQQYGRTDIDMDTVSFSDTATRFEKSGHMIISESYESGQEFPNLNFRRNYSNVSVDVSVDDIVIEIPDKADGSAESREFLFVIRPLGAAGR